jgi:hypothetical protein
MKQEPFRRADRTRAGVVTKSGDGHLECGTLVPFLGPVKSKIRADALSGRNLADRAAINRSQAHGDCRANLAAQVALPIVRPMSGQHFGDGNTLFAPACVRTSALSVS